MNIRELLSSAALPGSDTAQLDAELLLAHCLGRGRSHLYAWPEREVETQAEQRYRGLLARRAAGEPVAHLTGEREFWSLPLAVDPSTLIPRPDTERLVEVALELADARPRSVLDLGTGSGAIALALARERPAWQVTGIDLSAEAVALAEGNRARLGIANASFLHSDWFSALAPTARFGLIVGNPPYIAADDPHLDQGDVRFEPRSALVAGDDGLADIRRIVAGAGAFLGADGWLLLEHGWRQGGAVRALFAGAGYRDVESWSDYGGNERLSGGRRGCP
jgi:release factor glutamine methyltransferase